MLLVAVCLLAFAPAYNAEITNWDDEAYLSNPVAKRLSPAVFTTFVMGNYHPLTMLSFAVELRNARILHTTNVIIHAATAVLVLIFLQQLTGSLLAAFVGALLWTIHPLRVESVVWIAERKDVLFGFFYVAALIAYVAHVRGRRYALLAAFAFFVLSLLSKAMAVSLPLAMLAIDFLERRRFDRKSLLEKLPFFALSVIFAVIGYAAQRGPGALSELPGFAYSPLEKLALSCQALLFYLGKLFMPIRLSAFYTYPNIADWRSLLFIIIIIIIGLVAATVRATRTIAFAFIFVLVTIAVVLPLVSIGRTFAADRYMYIPSIGFAYAIAALVKYERKVLAILLLIAAVLGIATFNRSRVWHDSVTLWSDVIESDPANALAHNSRAVALAQRAEIAAAVRDLNTALALDPCYVTAIRNRVIIAARIGDRQSAARDLDRLHRCETENALRTRR